METLPCLHVRGDGTERRDSRVAWPPDVWLSATRATDWSYLACKSGRSVHHWGCPIRRTYQKLIFADAVRTNGLQARVPERLSPGSFDIWGSSHQIFHILVVLAAASHLVGLMKAFDYEHGLRTEASPSVFKGWNAFVGGQG